MFIAMLSDLHGRASTPVGRIDNYTERLWFKLEYMVDYCNKEEISHLVLAGDIIESVYVPTTVLSKLYQILSKFKGTIYVVYGNHDLQNHNYVKRETSPLSLLIDVLPNMIEVTEEVTETEFGHIYGTSWNQPIPKIVDPSMFNVLVIHKMIIHKKLWFSQKVDKYGKGSTLLKKHDFDLIISGDNHQQFVLKDAHKFLVNSGAMMRSTINEIDATPAFYVHDTGHASGNKPQKIQFPIENDVFDIDKLMNQKEQIENIDKFATFIEVLASNKVNDRLSFSRVFNDLLNATEDRDLIKKANIIFEGIGDKDA